MKFKKAEKHLKDVNMKKLFRRNQIIITTLAIMIAAAGYLNYAGKQELEAGAEGESFRRELWRFQTRIFWQRIRQQDISSLAK